VEVVLDFDGWLERLAAEPLPGGVAAAALAAAMGAALVAKAGTVTRRRRGLSVAEDQDLARLVALALARREALVALARADEEAYGRVLSTRAAAGSPAWAEVRRGAIDVPLVLAETCQGLLSEMDGLRRQCWPAVSADLEVGQRLLEVGVEAGRQAALQNLALWGDGVATGALRDRIKRWQREKVQ
jgi:formiminotetrahydrofolate cyclodeaminase